MTELSFHVIYFFMRKDFDHKVELGQQFVVMVTKHITFLIQITCDVIPYSRKFSEVNIFGNFRNTVHFLKFYFQKTGAKVVYQ